MWSKKTNEQKLPEAIDRLSKKKRLVASTMYVPKVSSFART